MQDVVTDVFGIQRTNGWKKNTRNAPFQVHMKQEKL